MFLCSTAAYSFAIPFASNGRCRLISLCQRYQDALSVTVLSHLYPEQGNLARVLTRRKKKKKKRALKNRHFLFRTSWDRGEKKSFRISLELLAFLFPFSSLWSRAWLLAISFHHYQALPKEKRIWTHNFLTLLIKNTANDFQNWKFLSTLIQTTVPKLSYKLQYLKFIC